jgi:hypothetical protein
MCTFCPQDNLKTNYGKNQKHFSVDDFTRIIDKLPRHVRVDFSGMAEPWANPDATEMLHYALMEGRSVAVYTTLFGMRDGARVATILETYSENVEVLCLHLPDANNNMRGFKYSKKYEDTLLGFIRLGQQNKFGRFEVMTMDKGGRVHDSLGHLGIKLGSWLGHSRAGNVVAPAGQEIDATPRHHGPVTCAFTPFYDQNVVLPNGDVVLCCMDYSIKHKIGNLLEQDYYDIFAGKEIGDLRSKNMQFGGTDTLCKSCNRARSLDLDSKNLQFWR